MEIGERARLRNAPKPSGIREERLKGLEPSTFCMASRRSSQLSYSRESAEYTRAGPPTGTASARLETC